MSSLPALDLAPETGDAVSLAKRAAEAWTSRAPLPFSLPLSGPWPDFVIRALPLAPRTVPKSAT
jgi:hypothetical protein